MRRFYRKCILKIWLNLAVKIFGLETAGLSHLRLSATQESGFYYLQSRYYDPSIGRFINADNQIRSDLTGSLNMFAYCGNNPVNAIDPTGHAFMFVTAAIGAVIGGIVGGVRAAKSGKSIWKGALTGAAIGGLVGLGAGAVAATILTGTATASTAAVLGTASLKLASTGTALGIGASKLLDRLANGYNQIKSGITGATDVFRSISQAEYANLRLTNSFNSIAQGFEGKQFGFSYSEVARFGQQFGQDIIVRASVPNNYLATLDFTMVDSFIFKSGTLTVWGHQLSQFNQMVSGTIQFMP